MTANTSTIKITATDNGFSVLRTLASICERPSDLMWRECIHVENNQMFATDGRILHRLKANPLNLESGNYQVVRSNHRFVELAPITSGDFGWPDWRSVFPKDPGKTFTLKVTGRTKPALSAAIARATGACLCQRYLDTLPCQEYRMSLCADDHGKLDPGKVVRFQSGNWDILIMPALQPENDVVVPV